MPDGPGEGISGRWYHNKEPRSGTVESGALPRARDPHGELRRAARDGAGAAGDRGDHLLGRAVVQGERQGDPFWNPTHDCPVFKVPVEERDFLIEADPETFFTTDHHRPWPLVLARPDRLDAGWARANIERVWRAQAKKRTLKAWDAAREQR